MLIEWLKEKQQVEAVGDAAFARRLRISRSYWTMFKNGDRTRPTYLLLQSAMRAYPDDREQLLSFLAQEVTTGAASATVGTLVAR